MTFASLDTENAVLALLLQNSDLIYVGDLEPDDFYDDKNRKIFETMLSLKTENKNFDYFVLAELFRNNSDLFIQLSKVSDYQMKVLESNFEAYVKILKNNKLKRHLHSKLLEFKERIEDDSEVEGEELLVELQDILNKHSAVTVKSFKEDLQEWWLEMAEKQNSDIIPSGIRSFDKKFLGFTKGSLNVIACRPSIGKTSLSIQLAYNMAKAGYSVCFYSLEMSKRQIISRLISQVSGVPHVAINTGNFINNTKIGEVLTDISNLNLTILDEDSLTIGAIEKSATILKKKKNIDVVIIDYLTLLTLPDGEKRTDRIGEITRRLKLLAKKLNIVIILLSQLNRNTETREEKRPHLVDLRDSGNIEQDADMVILLWRKPNSKGLPQEETELIISKNREGAIGNINLKFKSDILKFEEVEE